MSKASRRNRLAAGCALALLWAGPVLAAECDDVAFPDTTGTNLVLNGLGLRKATFLAIRVYVAGLYLPQKSSDPGQILAAQQPWQIVLHFVRDVDASDIRGAFAEGFEKSAGDKLAALQPRIATLTEAIQDLKKGETLSFVNDPAKGITADMNGKSGDPIQGADFATALLAIWLGPEPPNADLKSGLLGGACE